MWSIIRSTGVAVSGTVSGAAENGITEISFKDIQTEEITKAVIDENGSYSAVLKRVEGNTAYVASVSKAGFKIDDTNGASQFTLTGNSTSAVQDFTIAMAEVTKISGMLFGVPDKALKESLGMKLVPEDSTLNTVEVALNKVDGRSCTFAGVVIVPGQRYSVELTGANDYEVLETIVKESGTFQTSDGSQASVQSVTFTNMNEEQYSYTFPVTDGTYTARLRTGEYKTSADAPGYTAFDHVRIPEQAAKNIIYLEAPANTEPVPYRAALKVGRGQEFERIAQAVQYIKRMERTSEERVVIQLTDDLYREQIIIDTPNVSIQGTADKMPTVTWYYGIGYSYYSIAPAGAENSGFYSEKYAVDKYLKTACDTHWGTTVEVTAAGSGFESENVIYENSFNRYMTEEEVADGIGEGGDLTKINRSKATDADIKKYANKERACTMYVYADGGYITTSKAGGSQGYLFNNCKIVRTDYAGINTGTKKVFLGRPWGAGAKVLFYNTEVETADLIHPEGYATMANVTPAQAFYQEYNTHTPDGVKLGTAERAAGTILLTDEQAEAINNAIDALELKEEENPDNPDNPDVPDAPVISVGETTGNVAAQAVIGNAGEVEKAVTGIAYSQEELDAIHDGAPVTVKLAINSIRPTDEVLSLISDKFAGKEIDGLYYDIELLRKVGTLPEKQLQTLNGEITVTMQVPEEIKQANNGRLYVVRIHNGAAVILEDLDNSADTVTFKTDRFSTYALVYEKAESGEEPLPEPPTDEDGIPESPTEEGMLPTPGDELQTDKTASPQTGDLNFLVTLIVLLVSSGAAAVGFALRKKKEAAEE